MATANTDTCDSGDNEISIIPNDLAELIFPKDGIINLKSGDGITAELICTVCLKQYERPKSLPCAHTFCEQCLKNEIAAAVDKDKELKDGFPCPVCKALTLPKSGVPFSEWAADFPANTAINNIIDKLANNCPYHNTQERTLFCFDCDEILCTTCAWKSHRDCTNVLPLESASAKAKDIMKWYVNELEEKTHLDVPIEDLRNMKIKQLDEMYTEVVESIKNTAMTASGYLSA